MTQSSITQQQFDADVNSSQFEQDQPNGQTVVAFSSDPDVIDESPNSVTYETAGSVDIDTGQGYISITPDENSEIDVTVNRDSTNHITGVSERAAQK